MARRSILSASLFLPALLALGVPALAGQAQGPQASLTLENSNAGLCLWNTTDWTLTKEFTGWTLDGESGTDQPVPSGATVEWTVTVTRGGTTDDTLVVGGFVTILNSGSADATIGNIVVNLQRQRLVDTGKKGGYQLRWVSASADVADATNGDAAASAHIVAAASQEAPGWNAQWNTPATYVVSGAQGTFTENAASGELVFTDAQNNDAWAITPEKTIPPGESVNLLFKATFNNTGLGILEAEVVRAEIIVTFGNCNARAGSGASAQKIDIDGNGNTNGPSEPDEAYVRSVPTRFTLEVPPLEACNSTVTLTDPGVTTTGDVTASNFNNGEIGEGVELTDSATFTVTVDVAATQGGSVTNTAYLAGEGCYIPVVTGYESDPDGNLIPIYYWFECCPGIDLEASSTVWVGEEPVSAFTPGEYVTYSQGGYGGKGGPYNLLAANFAAVYPGGVEVGIPGDGGYSMTFTTAAAVQAYLPASGKAGALTTDLVDPTTSSSGVFGGQVLANQINVDLGDAGVLGTTADPRFGDLYYINPGDSLHGKTVREILAAANIALGGGAVPTGYTYASLTDLLDNLVRSFHPDGSGNPAVSPWAETHLSKTAP